MHSIEDRTSVIDGKIESNSLDGAKNYAVGGNSYSLRNTQSASANLTWRRSQDVVQMRSSTPTEAARNTCNHPGCAQPVVAVYSFRDNKFRPELWPEFRYFCCGHGKSFAKKRFLSMPSN